MSGEFPTDMGIPSLEIKILPESSPPESGILVRRLAVGSDHKFNLYEVYIYIYTYYICIYICIYIYTYIYIYIYIFVCTCTSIRYHIMYSVYIYIYLLTCLLTYLIVDVLGGLCEGI